MRIFQLQCFLAIVECKSFTKASYQLSISQSSLSKYISKLEDEFHIQLFDRRKRQLLLTPAGENFLPYARKAFCEYQEIKKQLLEYSYGGSIRIGSVDHMGKVGLTTPIAQFIEKFPEGCIQINIKISPSIQVIEGLLAGKTDIAFTAYIRDPVREVSNFDAYDLTDYYINTLVRDEYRVILSKNHPLASRESVSWEDLANEKLLILDKTNIVNQMIRDAFSFRHLQPHIAFECNQTDALLGMAASGFGISLLSDRVATTSYNIKKVKLIDSLTRDTCVIVPMEYMRRKKLIYHFTKHIETWYRSPAHIEKQDHSLSTCLIDTK